MNTIASSPFRDRAAFAPPPYRLAPFRFGQLDERRYVVTNDAGDFAVLARDDLERFARKDLDPGSEVYRTLKSRHFLFDEDSECAVDLLALKVRSRSDRVAAFTGLHIFVVTLRCDHSCHYCQVSRQTEDRSSFDMSTAHADKALDFTFRSPAKHIKIELQGGESLLNFELIRHIVERGTALGRASGKDVQFVIATNLARVDDGILAFCREHAVYLSTSLDGPEDLHNEHRRVRGGNSYDLAVAGIARARAALGADYVSALMTTTPASLERVEDIVDEYVRQGFRSIFLRSLSPYGFAVRTSLVRRYDVDAWLDFYKRGLAHILELNRRGLPFREDYASIILQKMFAPRGTGYVDLQSPAGIGIGAIVFNYDGAVYASDEGRMLAEMNDQTFRLGHLDSDPYEAIMTSERLLEPLEDSVLESVPMCTDCPFLPYCGADPVFHRATQGDFVGHKAFSAFCKKQMALTKHLIGLLEDVPSARRILMGWV